jgi:TolB-like protein/DNA-binding winged helix-turn-helix (wHTH) protein/Flp pilus assembly protein TadD
VPQANQLYEFGPFCLNPAEGRLTRDGAVVPLAPKAFEALLLLVENSGHLVSKEELTEKLWSRTVVEEANLAKYIFTLRHALGEGEKDATFIETVPKRGYRFVAHVRRKAPSVPPQAPASARQAWGRRIAALAALVALAVVAWLAWQRVSPPPAPPERRILLAVLPLDNLSGDPDQEYFSDGLTEEMTTQISRLEPERLGVIARTSSMTFKGAKKSVREIARELGVDYVLEGSVRRHKQRVRVTAQLIQVSDETHLLAESYDRDLSDILSLQGEVARAVADEIRIKLTPEAASRLGSAPTVDPGAHDAYLRGRYHWNLGEPEDLEKARHYYEQALEKDPRHARAYAALADYYGALPFYTSFRPDEVFPKAKAAVAQALELDDSLAEAHAALAYIRTYYDWDWAGAEEEFQRALALDPNDASLRHRYSRYLSSLGRIEEALAHMQRARELDPLSLIIKANVGVIYYFGRRYDQAVEQLQRIAKEEPEFSVAHWGLGLAYEQKGWMDQALAEFEIAVKLTERGTNSLASLGRAYSVTGKKQEARKILEELTNRAKQGRISAYQIALIHVGLDETDLAFEALERAFEERSTLLTYLKMDPRFDPLRSDPRFRELLRRMNFPG